MKIPVLGRLTLPILGCLLLLSIGAAARSQPAPLTLDSLAIAVERGDNLTVRRALVDPVLRADIQSAGQDVEFLQAIATSTTLDGELRRDAYKEAIQFAQRAIDDAPEPEAQQLRRAVAAELQGQYLAFLQDDYLWYRFSNLPEPLRVNFSTAESVASEKRHIIDATNTFKLLVGSCPGAECENRLQTIDAQYKRYLTSPPARAVDLLYRGLRREQSAYDALEYGRDKQRFLEARGRFLEAAQAYREAKDILAAVRPKDKAIQRLELYRLEAEARARSAEAAFQLPESSIPPPPPPPPPAPVPAPFVPSPPVASSPDGQSVRQFEGLGRKEISEPESRAHSLAEEEPGVESLLTDYQKACLRRAGENGFSEDPASAQVKVYYATTRRPVRPDPARDRYFGVESESFVSGDRRGVNFGFATVNVPCNRKRGEIKRPGELLFIQIEIAKDEKHFILKSVHPFDDRQAWLSAIGSDLSGSRRKEALLYVHGYNNSFAAASYRAAQLHADLAIDGATVFYSWASRENMLLYRADRRTVATEQEIQTLADTLIALRNSGTGKIYVIAHSMGNRLLLDALQRVATRTDRPERPFDELVLGSADIEENLFRRHWTDVSSLIGRTTLYTSSRDSAMLASDLFPSPDGQRLGDARGGVLTFAGVQTVDTTLVSGSGLGHDDYSGPALADMRATLWLSLAPNARCVLETSSTEQRYWTIRRHNDMGGDDCDDAAFDDAVRLTRLKGSPVEAEGWVVRRANAQPENSYLAKLRGLINRLFGKV